MAFSSTTDWDVRSTGSDSNGGGFDRYGTGTDYSQQDSPQISYTDLAIDATTNTKCTSSGHPFTSAHVGNVINITAGTGFTVQRVQIVSVTSGVATCDKSLGTLSSTGGTGVLGGGLATYATALGLFVDGNEIHIKSGTTTTFTSQSSLNGFNYFRVAGYTTVHNDSPTGTNRPLFTTSTNSIKMFSSGTLYIFFDSCRFSNTAGTPSHCFWANINGSLVLSLVNCKISGFDNGIRAEYSSDWMYTAIVLDRTEITACAIGCHQSGQCYVIDSWIHDNTSHGWESGAGSQAQGPLIVLRNVFSGNGGSGMSVTDSVRKVQIFSGNVFYNNTGAGLRNTAGDAFNQPNGGTNVYSVSITIDNNIFVSNGTYGIEFPSNTINGVTVISRLWHVLNNAFYGNGTAARHNFQTGAGDVTLTGNPFTNAAAGDFSLNATAGAGAACRAAGWPGVCLAGLSTTGYRDIGAFQHQDAGGGGGSGGAYIYIGG